MHITKWMTPIWQGHILYGSSSMTSWKRQNHGDNKNQRLSELEEGRDAQADSTEQRGILGQWKCSVWYYNDEYVSLHIFFQTHGMCNSKSEPSEWTTDIMVCRCGFILGLKKEKHRSGGSCWGWGRLCMCGAGGVSGISAPAQLSLYI